MTDVRDIRRVLTTYPRSGSHWLKRLLCDAMSVEPWKGRIMEPADAAEAVEHQATTRLVFEHFDTDMHGDILDPAVYPGLRIVLLFRNPLDVLISQFHKFAFDGLLPDNGLTTIENLKFYLRQYSRRNPSEEAANTPWPYPESLRDGVRSRIIEWVQSNRCLTIRYERLAENPARELTRALQHLLVPHTPEGVEAVVERNRFERFSKGRPVGVEDVTSHYRKGVPGEWREVYDDEDLEILQDQIGDYLQFLGYPIDAEGRAPGALSTVAAAASVGHIQL